MLQRVLGTHLTHPFLPTKGACVLPPPLPPPNAGRNLPSSRCLTFSCRARPPPAVLLVAALCLVRPPACPPTSKVPTFERIQVIGVPGHARCLPKAQLTSVPPSSRPSPSSLPRWRIQGPRVPTRESWSSEVPPVPGRGSTCRVLGGRRAAGGAGRGGGGAGGAREGPATAAAAAAPARAARLGPG